MPKPIRGDVPHWENFRRAVFTAHPGWEPYIVGERGGYENFNLDGDDRRFLIEIPPEHPSIEKPLVIEVADREPSGPIDVYWDRYFEHVFLAKQTPEQQFERVIRMVEQWIDDSWVFAFTFDRETGRKTGWGRFRFPLEQTLLDRLIDEGKRIEFWSWKGTHDGKWPA